MQFKLTLQTKHPCAGLPFNYHYPLSSAIYKIIQRADEEYASFLHERGYYYNGKAFKFFTFSDLRTPFGINGDRLVMTSDTASLIVCFHVPEAAENFIKGLFIDQQLDIADNRSKTTFNVQQITTEKMPVIVDNKAVLLQPMSPVVVGRKNERGNYDYVSPEDADFAMLVANNILDKYAAVQNTDEVELQQIKMALKVQPVFFKHPPRHRLLTIKSGTIAETKVRGYDKFRLRITAPAPIVEMALNAGVGMHNAMGMGSMELV